MGDAVRPDAETIFQILEKSRSLWSSFAMSASDERRLPSECMQVRNVLGKIPAFPSCSAMVDEKSFPLRYEHLQSRLRISGRST